VAGHSWLEHVRKSHIRKEELVQRVLASRGDAPGLVHVISAMESKPSCQPWHDKATGKTYLRGDTGKCLPYYFCFIDEVLCLCYLRGQNRISIRPASTNVPANSPWRSRPSPNHRLPISTTKITEHSRSAATLAIGAWVMAHSTVA
jgi:hypothetical protein